MGAGIFRRGGKGLNISAAEISLQCKPFPLKCELFPEGTGSFSHTNEIDQDPKQREEPADYVLVHRTIWYSLHPQ